MSNQSISPKEILHTVARVVYTDLVTITTTSVLFVLTALPVVSIGAALFALMRVWTDIVLGEETGGPITERGRVRAFVNSWRKNLWTGVPYSVILLLVFTGGYVYLRIGLETQNALFLLWTLLSGYIIAIVSTWTLRAASIRVRSARGNNLGFRTCMEEAGYSFLETPTFTILLMVGVAIVLFLGNVIPIIFIILGPGVLAVTEVIAFEELFGNGAGTIHAAYKRNSIDHNENR